MEFARAASFQPRSRGFDPSGGIDQAFEAWGDLDVPVVLVQHASARLKKVLA
jgi:hypothetical protein